MKLIHIANWCMIVSFTAAAAECEQTSIGRTPLSDFAAGETYHGLPGGLYPGESNEPPAEHRALGDAIAHSLAGEESTVLLSIGMSNATQAWWAADWDQPEPNPWTFAGLCAQSTLDGDGVMVVNGGKGGQTAEDWQPGHENYVRIRDFVLKPRGLTPQDVDVLWVKLANKVNDGPLPPLLPDENADAWQLRDAAEGVRTALREEYPNARMMIVSTRSYAGYAGVDPLPDVASPEPYAYESGYGLRAFIANHLGECAPWIAWGPYWWGDGKAYGWTCDLYQPDGIHHEQAGEEKQAAILFAFFLRSECTRPWFAARPADLDDSGSVDFTDQVNLLGVWGTDDAVADLDGNGKVGSGDLIWLLADWG